LSAVMNVARFGNEYMTIQEPWKKYNADDPDSLKEVGRILYNCLTLVVNLGKMLKPFLPDTSKKIEQLLNFENSVVIFQIDTLPNGYTINKAELLFEKIEDEDIQQQIDKLKKPMEAETPIEQKPNISFDEFMKMDIKVGTITAAQKVEKADKLLQLEVDMGSEKRTIVSGIAEHYAPEDVVGQQVSVLTNLEPRKIRGVESQGMILMAENEKGELAFVHPDKDMGPGSTIR